MIIKDILVPAVDHKLNIVVSLPCTVGSLCSNEKVCHTELAEALMNRNTEVQHFDKLSVTK